MSERPRTVILTKREFSAIAEAAAVYEAEWEGDDETPDQRRTNEALTRVLAKWHRAKPATPPPPPMLEVDKRYPYGH